MRLAEPWVIFGRLVWPSLERCIRMLHYGPIKFRGEKEGEQIVPTVDSIDSLAGADCCQKLVNYPETPRHAKSPNKSRLVIQVIALDLCLVVNLMRDSANTNR